MALDARCAAAALLLLTGTLGHAAIETRATTFVSRIPVVGVSEAPQGQSDNNWVVANLANGIWGTPPFYPGQQWMARHISEPGFDIWCRLDFGRPFTLEQVRLGNSCLGSFVHLKAVELEFEDGHRLPLTLARTRDPQSFDLPRISTSWVRIHLLSHYGDGSSIDTNSGGLAEVECYGLVPGRAERGTVPQFALAQTGGITSWLVAPRLTDAGQVPPWPVENEQAPEPAGHWNLLVSTTPEVRLDGGKGGLAFCSLRAEQPLRCRLVLKGATLLSVNGEPASDDFAVGPDGWTDLLAAVQGESFSAALLDESGQPATAVRVGLGVYANPEGRQRGWLEQLVRLRPAKPFIRPGQPIQLVGIPDGLGYPCFPVNTLETVTEVGPVTAGAAGAPFTDLTATGRYRVTGKLLPFGISRESVLTVSPWAAEDGGPVPRGFTDLDGDGDPDVLRTTIRGFDVLIVDDDDDMTPQTADRDLDSDLIMVDKDRDLVFDGAADFYYDAADLDGDGDCDIEYYNADQIVKTFLDLDDDNVLTGSLDWPGFSYGNEMAHTGSTNYLQDVHGNGYFRVSHDDDGDPATWERVVDLLRFGSDEMPLFTLAPDKPLPRTRTDAWTGGKFEVTNNAWSRLHGRFLAESQSDWQAALGLYKAAKARGWATSEALPECTLPSDLPMAERGRQTEYLVRPGYAGLLAATTPAEQACNAYWLREKVFAEVLTRLPEARRATAERLYYTGQVQELARQIAAGEL